MGKVVDDQTNKPIHNATIEYTIDEGTISNDNGEFSFEIQSYPIILKISHVSYHPMELVINTPLQSGLSIRLQPKTLKIEEVVVGTDRIKRYFKNQYFYVLDYAFRDNMICLLGYENQRLSKGCFIAINHNQDTLANINLQRPESFFEDAFGNLHIITKDSIYQVWTESAIPQLIYPTGRNEVSMEFFQLKFIDKTKFLFKIIEDDGLKNDYLIIDTAKQTRQVIKSIVNNQFSYNAYRPASYSRPRRSPPGRAASRDLSAGNMDAMRTATERYFYSTSIIHQPINSQIFRSGEKYILFDNINNRIIHFDENFRILETVKRKFPKHPQRNKQVIQDNENAKFYWVHYKGSRVLLGEIDIDTGKIINFLETPNYAFIEKIKIFDGSVWFTYQPRIGETVRSLYRQRRL